ncbi:amidohydrolase family protein [Pseudomonas argentinensis]|uniref:Predicted metal-dependent hydrolase, TIM-barrel fold n=1 Tax=Phytopseudomonas argentinensis TaxID=289370 RepID=A0A1I3N7F2_9GAMM|nr:amidohydrolase family protein [Pseudomonas argentinensis]KAB0550125.1 amidohydrolase family protein [Pseudomonas argentinensis]SFJ05201.1 Predicted metal-dependent hydrolase, TIM-barrel fold [Pseudomonas argentinensis]
MSTASGLSCVWDCHTHIYGPWASFPLPADAAYQPAPAPFSELLSMHHHLGISNGVLVQAAPYGTDHAAILEAIASSEGRYRGVGIIDESTGDDDLQALHEGGLRGIRFNLMGHLPGARDPQKLRRLAERVAPLGWHVLLHGELPVLLPILQGWRDLSTPIVIDHMARPDLTTPVDPALMRDLCTELGHANRWIKLSGIDRAMNGQSGPWQQGLDHVRNLLESAPERAIWGSDWPHPNIKGDVPDDVQLLDFIREVCGSATLQQAVLADNPARLYR